MQEYCVHCHLFHKDVTRLLLTSGTGLVLTGRQCVMTLRLYSIGAAQTWKVSMTLLSECDVRLQESWPRYYVSLDSALREVEASLDQYQQRLPQSYWKLE